MAESPRFLPMSPQIVPIYGPPQPPNVFSMTGQPIFPMPPQFGYPPVTWSPITRFPQSSPISQQAAYSRSEDDLLQQHFMFNDNNNNSNYHSEDDFLQQHSTFYDNNNNNNNYQENSPLNKQQQQFPRHLNRHVYTRNNVSHKFDTRHEEFRKYLEKMGILSTFTNILSEMYEDPLRPKDPLGFIKNKLNCSRPETVEISNLRLWCDQYQARTVRLEKELKHVIERLRNYEPYNTDDSLFDDASTENECKPLTQIWK